MWERIGVVRELLELHVSWSLKLPWNGVRRQNRLLLTITVNYIASLAVVDSPSLLLLLVLLRHSRVG